ncbi:MAG: SatD family protein [Candidatus Thiodiazotropha sp.]
MSYLVLIGDLVASRQSTDRKGLQNRLEALLKLLNERASKPLSPYTLTLGDEFQVVFNRADRVFVDMVQIMEALHPDRVRFSLGLGNIATELNPYQAVGMDGPAFYRARDGINRLKESGELFHLDGLAENCAPLAEGTLRLLSQRFKKWEANRLAILHGLLVGNSVKAIAKNLSVSEQAVYKNIRSGGLEAVIQVLSALAELLNNCLAEDGSTD